MATVEADTRAEAVVDLLGALYYGDLSADDFMLFPEDGGVGIEFDDEADIYWQRSYGGQDAFECLVRTILSQNTSDKASQPAHDALVERYGGGDLAEALSATSHADLADTISSAGLYNQKAERIIDIAAEVCEEFGGADGFDEFVKGTDPGRVRERLLAFGGVGPKTADCVLLFAGGREGVFPVDTHVHRIYRRLGVAPADADHEAVRETLEAEVPGEK